MESSSLISISKSMIYVLLLVFLVFIWSSQSCYGFGSFGFDIHHRYSDAVKGMLDIDELPETGSLDYYVALAHRDKVFRGRGLAAGENTDGLLTFSNGNRTIHLPFLGFLHYANVSLGTPSLSFLVALDTGSDLFWVPCDCGQACIQGLSTRAGDKIDLNIYSSNTSSTSKQVPCSSSLCEYPSECPAPTSQCPYQVSYISNGTSSTGVLVEDVLHLTAEDGNPQVVDAPITFGCGRVQTGLFLDSGAPNGLFGLGMEKSSVPSILSSSGLVANSFSMCFGTDGIGRISFGDKGSADQEETPFNLRHLHPTYNITVTQITVDKNQTNVSFSAIFDSGTSWTYLNDPAYTSITETFNSQALDRRHASDPRIPFEYCYDTNPNSTGILVPNVTLTMKGGNQYPIINPIIGIFNKTGYCLAVVKTPDVNIIGQNFMTGYHIVFDREKMVLGWKKSNCYDIENSNTLATNRSISPVVPPAIAVPPGSYPPEATNRPISPVVPPAIAVQPGSYTPEATKNENNSGASQPSVGKPPRLYLIISSLLMLLVPILLIG